MQWRTSPCRQVNICAEDWSHCRARDNIVTLEKSGKQSTFLHAQANAFCQFENSTANNCIKDRKRKNDKEQRTELVSKTWNRCTVLFALGSILLSLQRDWNNIWGYIRLCKTACLVEKQLQGNQRGQNDLTQNIFVAGLVLRKGYTRSIKKQSLKIVIIYISLPSLPSPHRPFEKVLGKMVYLWEISPRKVQTIMPTVLSSSSQFYFILFFHPEPFLASRLKRVSF